MAKVALPDRLPGEFFVLAYDPDGEEFSMIVDDAGHSSYKLGSDIPAIMRYFKRIGISELGNRTIDVAREFRLVQAVFADGRTLIVKENVPAPMRFADEDHAPLIQLPNL